VRCFVILQEVMGRACSTYGSYEKAINNISRKSWRTLDLDNERRIIL
jgi:hypothetical protein